MNTKTEKGYLNHILVEDGKKPMIMQEMPEKPNVWQESPGDEELYQKLLAKAKSEAIEIADKIEDYLPDSAFNEYASNIVPGIYPIVTPVKFEVKTEKRCTNCGYYFDGIAEHDDCKRSEDKNYNSDTRQLCYYREPSEQPKYFLCDACVGTGMNPKMSTTQGADSPYCPYCDGLGWVPESNYKSPYGEPSEQHPEDTCQKCGGPNVLWYAESELFNKVNGSPNGIICPKCFIKMASEQGESIIFKAVRIKGEPSEQPKEDVKFEESDSFYVEVTMVGGVVYCGNLHRK